MSLSSLPRATEIDATRWESFAPYYEELQNRPLDNETVDQWLQDWSDLSDLASEVFTLKRIATDKNTADEEAEAEFNALIQNVYPRYQQAEQALKERMLQLDIPNPDMVVPLKHIRSETELYREENVPRRGKLIQLGNKYDKITGGLTAEWDGEEKSLSQLLPYLGDQDRAVREKAWRTYMDKWQSVRPQLNDLFLEMLTIRREMAATAGFDDYRSFVFLDRGRFDYTPDDCLTFHQAIEEAVVPLANRILQSIQDDLSLNTLRPWDWMPEKGILVEAGSDTPLRPYETEDELIQGGINIFNNVNAELGHYFADMADNNLLDLQSRPHKSMGGYCATLNQTGKPFIFMNGVGDHDTVQTLLHEAGHAFHAYESLAHQPLVWQQDAPLEFCEVASMAMELLAAPYLSEEHGGYYTTAEAARARSVHLQSTVLFLPYMATVDAFQHWLYTAPAEDLTIDKMDAKWSELEERFMPQLNWNGLEGIRSGGWHRKLHIFQIPFYYIEYGMAQIGALQVWRNSMDDGQEAALNAYRQGLMLGNTKSLPDLFQTAGAEFRFDTDLLQELMAITETTIEQLAAVRK